MKTEALKKLDDKITRHLTKDRWNEASKKFIRALWDDYKNAHTEAKKPMSSRSYGVDESPEIKSYDDYVGSYQGGPRPGQPFIAVKKDKDNDDGHKVHYS